MALVTEALALAVALAVVTRILVALARLLRAHMHFRRLERAIPGPPTLPLIGNVYQLLGLKPHEHLRAKRVMVGDRRKMARLFSVLNHLEVAVGDPAVIQEALSRREFDDKSVLPYSLLRALANKSLVAISGDEWKLHRKWLAPAFSKGLLDQFNEVFSEEARAFVDRVRADKELSLADNLKRVAVRNILRTSFNCEDNAGSVLFTRVVEFLHVADGFFATLINRMFNPLLWWDKLFLQTAVGKAAKKARDRTSDAIVDLFRLMPNEKHRSPKNGTTLADLMNEEVKNGTRMPKQDVLDEAMTFIVAAEDTTVTTQSWMLKALSMLPDIQDRIYAEVQEVVGDSDRPFTTNDIPQLQYVDRVVKECLRMFPAFAIIARHCYAETTLGGYTIPAGCSVIIDIEAVHRDPEHWVDPERFDPDRFLPENSVDRHPYAFIPFSRGRRDCIAARYAMNNLRIFLATTIRAYKVLPVDDYKDLKSLYDNMKQNLTTQLEGGVRVRFQTRLAQKGASGAGDCGDPAAGTVN